MAHTAAVIILLAAMLLGVLCWDVGAPGSMVSEDVTLMQIGRTTPRADGDVPEQFGVMQVLGVLLACLGLMLAAGGGIGGGGILVPTYILVMGFSPKFGVPLSNITILGGAIANNCFNLSKRHPNRDVQRPMIDYDLVLLMEPPTIAGAVVGSILNKVLPEYIITTLLVLVLGATTYKTWTTGNKLWKKEQNEFSRTGRVHEDLGWCDCFTALAEAQDDAEPLVGAHPKAEFPDTTPEVLAILEDEAQFFPWWKIGAITLCFVLVVVSNVLKLAVTECGTPGYWAMMMLPVFITVGMMFCVRSYLLDKGDKKRSAGILQIEGDVQWDSTTTVSYPIICTVAGLFAGMFGIGGGIVKGPLMLEMGILPEVSAATAAYMILYTAASATVTYAAFDLVEWDYALVLFPCGIVFTTVGQHLINGYIKRTNHASIIVFIIAAIVGLSTILMGYESGVVAAEDIENGVGMHDICDGAY